MRVVKKYSKMGVASRSNKGFAYRGFLEKRTKKISVRDGTDFLWVNPWS